MYCYQDNPMFTITTLTISFLAALSCKIKKVKAPVFEGLLWYSHLVLLFFSIISVLLLVNDYGFKGIRTERIFLSLYAGSGMILYGLSKGVVTAKQFYLFCFFSFPFMLILGVLLPPLKMLTLVIGISLLADGNLHRYKIDDDFALQASSLGIFSPQPEYALVEDKYWFFEKVTAQTIDYPVTPKALHAAKITDDSVYINISPTSVAVKEMDTTIRLRRK
jgi:hypothetical protein